MGEPRTSGTQQADLLLEHAVVITMDEERRILQDASVVIRDGKIADVLENGTGGWSAARRIDCGGNILLPGFVEGIGQAGWTGQSGSGDKPISLQRKRLEWVRSMTRRQWYEEGVREAEISLAYGITTAHRVLPAFVPESHVSAYQEGAAEAGLRLILSWGPDVNADDEVFRRQTEQVLAGMGAPLRRLHLKGPETERQAAYPRSLLPECTLPGMLRRGERMEFLLREAPADCPLTAFFRGGELERCMEKFPALARRPMLIYGLYGATHHEITQMVRAGSHYVHVPLTFLQSSRLLPMLFAGIPCALASGADTLRMPQDLLQAGRRAMLEEITARDDYHYLPSGKVLELLTIDGAKALGMDGDSGSITPGKRADLNLLCWHSAHLEPNFMPVQAVAQRGYGRDITMVIAQGKIVRTHRNSEVAP